MLRRYLITNIVSTALMYGAFLALVPELTGTFDGAVRAIELYAIDHAWLAPVLHGVLQVSGAI